MLRAGMASALVGTQLASVMDAADRVVSPRERPVLISPVSHEALGIDLRLLASAAPTSQNYPAANTAIFYPFGIADPILVLKLWWQNGAAVAGQIDVGIFAPDGTLIVGLGTTGQAGTTTVQEGNIADTRLGPGRYYLGITSDTSGATQKVLSTALANSGQGSAMGLLQAAQGPSLVSVTFAAFAQTAVPFFGLSGRSLVV